MFEIHKNNIYDHISHVKPYLDTLKAFRKYNLTVFNKNILSNDNFS